MGWEASALAGGTRSGGNQGQRPALAKPPAEPTPSGASSPASLLRCLPVMPLCVLPRRGMTEATGVARSNKGENGERQAGFASVGLCGGPSGGGQPHGGR